ncbi:MAG: ABC transporter permease [Alphaproteobacteria bacterium]
MIGRLDMPALIRLGVAALILIGAVALPAGSIDDRPVGLSAGAGDVALLAIAAAAFFASVVVPGGRGESRGALLAVASVALGVVLLLDLGDGLVYRGGAPAVLLLLIAIVVLLWQAMSQLSAARGRAAAIVVPLLFGGLLVYLWEALTVGFQVPAVLLPPPSAIAESFRAHQFTLWIDFRQTFIKSVIPGFVMGSGAGFLVAVAIDRSPFLQRGLQPLGSMISAMPIVGIAPIMVMWFGFDWQSKAAVIVVMTFFPMLVNTLAGLQVTGLMERDLMRSYAASYFQALVKLRLPGAMPFVFNALKLNSTLALIGAIVAEFFGTPIMGMGFRISTEVAKLNVDFVWATIAVAALAGSASYGALVLMERATTFWHPSYRK